jgi:hypothetical protein
MTDRIFSNGERHEVIQLEAIASRALVHGCMRDRKCGGYRARGCDGEFEVVHEGLVGEAGAAEQGQRSHGQQLVWRAAEPVVRRPRFLPDCLANVPPPRLRRSRRVGGSMNRRPDPISHTSRGLPLRLPGQETAHRSMRSTADGCHGVLGQSLSVALSSSPEAASEGIR